MMAHHEEQPQALITETIAVPPRSHSVPDSDALDDGMLSTEDVAKLLGVDASTLRRWRTAEPPLGPPFISIAERVTKYCKCDVRQWIALRRVSTLGMRCEAAAGS
jgi:hypothetical protein